MFKKLSAALVAMSLVTVAQHASAQNNSVSAAQAAAPASAQLSPVGKKVKALADEVARAEAAKKKSVADMQALVDASKAAKAAAGKK